MQGELQPHNHVAGTQRKRFPNGRGFTFHET
jgi:hypothetical protein